MKTRKYTETEIIEYLKNIFPSNEIMFAYYCGSIAYETASNISDIDITVIYKDLKGIVHASFLGMDIFAYGYDDFIARQSFN